MKTDFDRRAYVAFGVIEKRGSVGGHAQPLERESIDRRIRFAHAHLVAVDHIMEQTGKIEHRPPTFAQFTNVVRENSQTKSGVTEFVHQIDDGDIGREIEGDRLAGFWREGPSVQVAAGVMHDARRWLRPGSAMNEHALLVAGGAAGIAAAFNAPLAGVVFAIEELSRKLESRNSGLIIAAIVLAGLMGVSAFGNYAYFGSMVVPTLDWNAVLPALLVIVCCGAFGGLFSRLLAASLTGSPDRFSDYRARNPIRFAAAGGLVVAIIGLVTHGATFGAGGEEVRAMLSGEADISQLYFLLKLIATWISTWCGVPGGIFAPSLSIGAGIGHDVAQLTLSADDQLILPALIAMGMAGFLAAVTQAPLTSFIIVMEMLDGRPMVLSLMASAMIASLISRLISRPLYTTLSEHMISRVTGQPVTPAKHE